ncbi:MAG: hypothetical protein JXA21_11385 [Anaerolineae bacterium]|nr:hypothetical protein [Anaerolineae bacterium]
MKSALELFGEGWRHVDATVLDDCAKRRALGFLESHREVTGFGLAYNALVRSLCRTDKREYITGWEQGTYRPLLPGMFTLEDVLAEYLRWKHNHHYYIYGFSKGSKKVMEAFFRGVEPAIEVGMPGTADDLRQIFEAILDAAKVAAFRSGVANRVVGFEVRSELLENVQFLARCGLEILTFEGRMPDEKIEDREAG